MSLYKILFMDSSRQARRTDSSFVYLNLWDEEGDFCYQLAYDPTTRQIEKSEQPYY